jgi:probable DNA metabolism protein
MEGAGGPPFPLSESSPPGFSDLRHSPSAALLRELSADAFDAVVHAWMSELPIGTEIVRYAWGVILAAFQAAAREEAFRVRPPETEPPGRPNPPAEPAGTPAAAAGPDIRAAPDAPQTPGWAALPEARRGAGKAASDRSGPEARAVLEAAYKAGREIDRLRGLLRFRPCSSGSGGPVYVARCSPDHYVLPGLAEHFTQRFGQCPWAVIDEKRGLVLAGEPGRGARLFPLVPDTSRDGGNPGDDGHPGDHGSSKDCYEVLWRNYHRSINNPDRNNPALQRQFMPRRYWKYLTEFQ